MDVTWNFDDYASGGNVICRFGRYEAWQQPNGACVIEVPRDDDKEAVSFSEELIARHKATGKIWEGEPDLLPAMCKCGREL